MFLRLAPRLKSPHRMDYLHCRRELIQGIVGVTLILETTKFNLEH